MVVQRPHLVGVPGHPRRDVVHVQPGGDVGDGVEVWRDAGPAEQFDLPAVQDAVVAQDGGDLQEVRPEDPRRQAGRALVGAGVGLQRLADHVAEVAVGVVAALREVQADRQHRAAHRQRPGAVAGLQ